MHKVLALFSGAICLFSALSVAAAPSIQKPQSFAQLCIQKKSVPADTRHTIEVLLKEAGTNNCQQADAKLRNLDSLQLTRNQIIDVKPLAGLSNLTDLWLTSNQIVDVKPLAGLSNLTNLYLGNNKIFDVKPLAGLSNLYILALDRNKIVAVKPLAGLRNLYFLALDENKIVDVKPLVGLRNLTNLYLYGNQITVKVCPVKPESSCKFSGSSSLDYLR